MNQHELQKRLIRYQGEIEQIGFWLGRAKQSLPEDFEGYRSSLQDAAGLAEQLACGIRDIRVETCFLPRAGVLRKSAQVQGILVEAEEHWHRILLPGLLPKRKTGSCAFLTGPLAAALTEYGKTHPIRRLQRAVVCFRHLYSESLPERLVRDHDNIEVKQVLDVIADHFLVDDNGLLCTNLYTSAMGDSAGTEVYVMAPEHLGNGSICTQSKRPERGSKPPPFFRFLRRAKTEVFSGPEKPGRFSFFRPDSGEKAPKYKRHWSQFCEKGGGSLAEVSEVREDTLLGLTALCGDLPVRLLPLLPGSTEWTCKTVLSLRAGKLLMRHHKNGFPLCG